MKNIKFKIIWLKPKVSQEPELILPTAETTPVDRLGNMVCGVDITSDMSPVTFTNIRPRRVRRMCGLPIIQRLPKGNIREVLITQVSSIEPNVEAPEEGTLGTRIVWAESPEEAASLAEKQGKLVFLIHVSGNFERAEFT